MLTPSLVNRVEANIMSNHVKLHFIWFIIILNVGVVDTFLQVTRTSVSLDIRFKHSIVNYLHRPNHHLAGMPRELSQTFTYKLAFATCSRMLICYT